MSRERYKVTKRISPENTPSENRKLAQFGELWDTPEFTQAWHWRYMLALCDLAAVSKTKDPKAKRLKAEIIREIGEATAEVIAKGHSDYFRRLAVALKFVNERVDWNVKTPHDLALIYTYNASKFTPVDKLREAITREYYFVHGGEAEEARKSRKNFMAYIAKLTRRKVDEKGAFAKAFGRACEGLGIRWR